MADLLRERLCVVLVRTQGPINLGLIARACGNTGIEDLRLVDPQCTIDCDEARKFANHQRDFLLAAPVFPDLASALADCHLAIGTSGRARDEGFGPPVGLADIPPLIAHRQAMRCALVFGNEADGLTTEELRLCHHCLHLDTPGTYSSYNLSHAVAIVAHALCAHTAAAQPQDPPAPMELVSRLATYWLDSLQRINYFRRTPRSIFEPEFRRLVARMQLTARDATTLFGTLAQVNYFHFGDRGSTGLGHPDSNTIDPEVDREP